MHLDQGDPTGREVTLWLDPVCPFTWNTAQWLHAVAEKAGFDVNWQLMSLAILNEGQELPPPQQARMRDSQRAGRLMAAIAQQNGTGRWKDAYFAFGKRYFDRSAPLDDDLAAHVLTAVGATDITAAAATDASLDDVVRRTHQAGQDALGETGGSPILRIDRHAFFGPVLTAPPDQDASIALFDAVATLAAVPQFSQLQRPRDAA